MSEPLDDRARRQLPAGPTLVRHDAAVFDLRLRRDKAIAEVSDFASLRAHAARLKDHVLDHLDVYLERFEERATQAGAVVHWAADAEEHNRIVAGILSREGVRRVVKSKSMLTEECGLNPALEARGMEVVDTDLGERIVQLWPEPPSHIVVPAVHRSRQEIGALFHRHLGSPADETDPVRLTEYARRDLRPRFLAAEAGITGVNFAIAETGTIVICTNEGNADLGMSLPPLHIACMGIEKLVPSLADLSVFLRLLARSATGQPITAYTSLVTGPRRLGALHIVIVDNGRSRLLADPEHRSALACIRCGACLNTCPVYRQAGGHAYARSVAGPIGAVLAPVIQPGREGARLPRASTLCGSCSAVCPVGIDLHAQLLAWRRTESAPRGLERLLYRGAAWILCRPRLFRAGGVAVRGLWPLLARRRWGSPARSGLVGRALPPRPPTSFAALYRRRPRPRTES